MMVSDVPDVPVLPKVCPYISYSNATVFCRGEFCHDADHDRFKEEGFCFLLITEEPVGMPKKGDNDR